MVIRFTNLELVIKKNVNNTCILNSSITVADSDNVPIIYLDDVPFICSDDAGKTEKIAGTGCQTLAGDRGPKGMVLS